MSFTHGAAVGQIGGMAKGKGTHFVVTASITDSGSPTYLTARGTWSAVLHEARLFESEADANGSAEQASVHQQRWVSDPYTFMVAVEEGKIDPLSAKEYIRANGPTVRVRRPD